MAWYDISYKSARKMSKGYDFHWCKSRSSPFFILFRRVLCIYSNIEHVQQNNCIDFPTSWYSTFNHSNLTFKDWYYYHRLRLGLLPDPPCPGTKTPQKHCRLRCEKRRNITAPGLVSVLIWKPDYLTCFFNSKSFRSLLWFLYGVTRCCITWTIFIKDNLFKQY